MNEEVKEVKLYTGWTKVSKSNLERQNVDETKGCAVFKEKTSVEFPEFTEGVNLLKEKIEEEKQKQEEEELLKEIFGLNEPEPIICFTCGQVIKEEYFTFYYKNEINVCNNCYRNLNKCQNCGFPVKKTIHGIVPTHCKQCKSSEKCYSCGRILRPKEVNRIPFIYGIYCDDCIKKAPLCMNCGKPGTIDIIELKDQRLLCKSCYSRIINDRNDLELLFRNVNNYIRDKLFINEYFPYPIKLVEFETLMLDKYDTKGNKKAYFTKIVEYKDKQIYTVSKGITKEKAIKEFSMEMGKFIYNKLNPKEITFKYEEAFAVWFSCMMLKKFGYIEETLKTVNNNLKYAKILKVLNNIENTAGPLRVLEKLKKGEIVVNL